MQAFLGTYTHVARYIKDDFLRRVFSFHPLLVGGNPFATPSVYTLVAQFEKQWGVLQGLLSWLVAVPVSFAIAQPLARLLGQTMLDIDLDFAYDWLAVAIWLGVVIISAAYAAISPARHAARISVREALAYA